MEIDLDLCIEKMRAQGVWISERTAREALKIISQR